MVATRRRQPGDIGAGPVTGIAQLEAPECSHADSWRNLLYADVACSPGLASRSCLRADSGSAGHDVCVLLEAEQVKSIVRLLAYRTIQVAVGSLLLCFVGSLPLRDGLLYASYVCLAARRARSHRVVTMAE